MKNIYLIAAIALLTSFQVHAEEPVLETEGGEPITTEQGKPIAVETPKTPPAPAPAQPPEPNYRDEKRAYAGIMFGVFKETSGSKTASQGTATLRIGMNVAEGSAGKFSLGAYAGFLGEEETQTINGTSIHTEESTGLYMVEGLFRDIGGTGIYFGPRAGIVYAEAEVSSGTTRLETSASPFVYGAGAGYEMQFNEKHGVNIDFSHLSTTKTKAQIAGQTIDIAKQGGFFFQIGYMLRFN